MGRVLRIFCAIAHGGLVRIFHRTLPCWVIGPKAEMIGAFSAGGGFVIAVAAGLTSDNFDHATIAATVTVIANAA